MTIDKLKTIIADHSGEDEANITAETTFEELGVDSLTTVEGAMIEPSLDAAAPGERFQFVRFGYFCKDTKNENTYNQVVSLKDNAKK